MNDMSSFFNDSKSSNLILILSFSFSNKVAYRNAAILQCGTFVLHVSMYNHDI